MIKKRILIIGNGFDIEHGLPTKYNEFLEFCNKLKLKNNEEIIDEISNETDGEPEEYFGKWLQKLREIIDTNTWFQYFNLIMSEKLERGENWIDFESEICEVIEKIDKYYSIIDLSKAYIKMEFNDLISKASNLLYISREKREERKVVFENEYIYAKIIWIVSKAIYTNKKGNNQSEVINFLYNELNNFIRAFELYLCGYIRYKRIEKRTQNLENIEFDYILSFNYTNTYERVFKDKIKPETELCYIHGKAKDDEKANERNCNMVLGINEYLDDDEKDINLNGLKFKKYFQRIQKCTDNGYTKWIEDIKNLGNSSCDSVEYELYIFGHSLDVTDKDVLRSFILNDNVKTKIFYRKKDEDDRKSFSEKIENLVKVIGSDELIKRTGGGAKNSIEFIPQK